MVETATASTYSTTSKCWTRSAGEEPDAESAAAGASQVKFGRGGAPTRSRVPAERTAALSGQLDHYNFRRRCGSPWQEAADSAR